MLHFRLCAYKPLSGVQKIMDLNSPFVTVLHGDCWVNNMFFKKDVSGELKLKMIDYGMIHRSDLWY